MGKDPQSFLSLKTFIEYDIIHSFKTSRLGGLIPFFSFILFANIIHHCFAIQANTVEVQCHTGQLKNYENSEIHSGYIHLQP